MYSLLPSILYSLFVVPYHKPMIWTWNLDPIAFHLIGLPIRWYGLAYILGFFIASYVGFRIHKKIVEKSLTKESWEKMLFGVFFAGLLGGRLGYFFFYETSSIFSDPLQILKVWQGGMSIHGGILGAIIYLILKHKKYKISLLRAFDSLVIPLSIALIFGRLANFINGELVGTPTGTDWGVIFPHIDSQVRHPSQIYEMGKNTINSILLLSLVALKHYKKEGLLSIAFLFGYGIMRFLIEFVREPEIVIWSLSMGQWLCIGMVLFATFLIYKKYPDWQKS